MILFSRDIVSSVHHFGGNMVLDCPITGDVKLDHLVRLVSIRFLHYKDTSPIVINKLFVTVNIWFLKSLSHNAFSIHVNYCLN